MTITAQKEHGVVYTPDWIVGLILDKVGYSRRLWDKKLADPACGDGAFLTEAVRRFLHDAEREGHSQREIKARLHSHFTGFDIDRNALRECARRLDKVAQQCGISGKLHWDLRLADSTDARVLAADIGCYDFVVGNPPYVRIQHLGHARREKIRREWRLCSVGSTDIYIAFFELGVRLLTTRGRLGYITPNTYLKTHAGRGLRYFLTHNNLLKTLIDFEHHQIFPEVTTYTLITILEKNRSLSKPSFSLYKGDSKGKLTSLGKIKTHDLSPANWVLASGSDLAKLRRLREGRVRLGDIADIHVGITTLADSYYIVRDPEFVGKEAIIQTPRGAWRVEKRILQPIVKASVLRAESEKQNRYVIFPYKKQNGRQTIIPEAELQREYPLTYRYFTAVRDALMHRDKGRENPVAWYAFGRAQGLDTSFGEKILTSPMNMRPNFLLWRRPTYTFYSGYCVKFDGDLEWLATQLNSAEMAFYINLVSRDYQNNYKSFAKSFIADFYLPPPPEISSGQQEQLFSTQLA